MGLGGCNKDLSVKGWESICRATRHSATLSSLQLDASFLDKFKVRPSAGSVCHWSDLKRGLCIGYHAACTFSCITYIWVLFTYVLEYICIFVYLYLHIMCISIHTVWMYSICEYYTYYIYKWFLQLDRNGRGFCCLFLHLSRCILTETWSAACQLTKFNSIAT